MRNEVGTHSEDVDTLRENAGQCVCLVNNLVTKRHNEIALFHQPWQLSTASCTTIWTTVQSRKQVAIFPM